MAQTFSIILVFLCGVIMGASFGMCYTPAQQPPAYNETTGEFLSLPNYDIEAPAPPQNLQVVPDPC